MVTYGFRCPVGSAGRVSAVDRRLLELELELLEFEERFDGLAEEMKEERSDVAVNANRLNRPSDGGCSH